MKAIMISIKPQYVADILNGKKTLEIRKTLPKCELPIEVYIYCTKGCKKDWHLIEVVDTDTGWKGYEYDYYIGSKGYLKHCLEGKVVAKFTLNKVERLYEYQVDGYGSDYEIASDTLKQEELLKRCYLTYEELSNYLGDINNGYAWHIDNLVVFDKPKEISEFKQEYNYFLKNKTCSGCPRQNCDSGRCLATKPLTRAPQSWCYVEV